MSKPSWEIEDVKDVDLVAEGNMLRIVQSILDEAPDVAFSLKTPEEKTLECALTGVVKSYQHVNAMLVFLRLELLYDVRGDSLRRSYCAYFGGLCWSFIEENWFGRICDGLNATIE